MKYYYLVTILFSLICYQILAAVQFREDVEDNEFAEFEEFDEEEVKSAKPYVKEAPQARKIEQTIEEGNDFNEDDVVVEDDESEIDHFNDDEEFEGFDGADPSTKSKEAPKITITNVPLHLRTNFNSFYLEILMISGLVIYFLNFFTGKNKNIKIATSWFETHKSLLKENFTLVGDDGKVEMESETLIKESDSVFTLWCSGRTCCDGMLVELKLIKRQDLVAVIANWMRPSNDQIHVRIDVTKEDMDSFVLCIANKKMATKLSKEMNDLSIYCPERKPGDKFRLSNNFNVMSEISEATNGILDSKVTNTLNTFAKYIDCIHISDQFSGPKPTEDVPVTTQPETKKVMIFEFNFPSKSKSTTELTETSLILFHFIFYIMNRVKRLRLSKESKAKADKNRAKVEESFLKSTHAARAEAAAARKEEKKRLEKERILQEEDPLKQKRWEEKELKRQMKKKTPKMKQLKVKAV
ncbi:unnamed protein product [Bemisia tabaci]|uniref:PAT complex subunit CCDC47 n=1 Tax=Bemisia tabaci TaxID=7038 RepID=A0A9P0ABN4_BEMTA|nr:unnamed protein product [Bemisia tabaci]